MPKLYYSVSKAARTLGFSKFKVYRLIRRNFLNAVRIGPRSVRIPAEALNQFASELQEFRQQYYSRKEASRRLRVTTTSIDNWAYDGRLSAFKFATEPIGVLKEDVHAIDPGARQMPKAA